MCEIELSLPLETVVACHLRKGRCGGGDVQQLDVARNKLGDDEDGHTPQIATS